MKIAATDFTMQSTHAAAIRHERSETLRSWIGERPDFEAMTSATSRFSAAARQLLASDPPPSGETRSVAAAQDAIDSDPFLSLIRQMIEFLTGEEVKVFDLQDYASDLRHVDMQADAGNQNREAASQGWGVEYDAHAVHEEFEQTTFSATGTIRTADGQEFSFQLDLQMTRHYREETHVSLRAGDARRKDPLVVNFGGTATQLADRDGQRFRFDLDGDGQAELLPLFASGSGYLALDRNRNGRIDSGRELFGPATGHGFAELTQLDDNGNGWLDENDAGFADLSVWTPDATGKGDLRTLAELGIGALGLANTATPFDLRGNGNADLGLIKASGLYLTEDGRAGSLQEIDLTV